MLPLGWGKHDVDLIKTEFKQNTDVRNVSLCYNTPVNIVGGYNMRKPEMPENSQIAVNANPVDDEFLPDFRIAVNCRKQPHKTGYERCGQ